MTKKNSQKKRKPAKDSKEDWVKESFKISPKAKELVDQALKIKSQTERTKEEFVSECIEAYGPNLLTEDAPSEMPTFGARLDFLESILLPMAYDKLVEKLRSKKAIDAHQAVLKKVGPLQWWSNLTELKDVAGRKKKTTRTNKLQWMTLIRNYDEFLEEESVP